MPDDSGGKAKDHQSGLTRLHHAVVNDRSDLVRLLIESGGSLNPTARGVTPVAIAIVERRVAIAAELIEKGAQVDIEEIHNDNAKAGLGDRTRWK